MRPATDGSRAGRASTSGRLAPPPIPGENRLGAWSLAASVGGLLTLGLLCPIGLIMGICALGRPPRGFARAAVAVGMAGTLLGVFWGAGAVAGFVDRINNARSAATLVEAIQAIERERPRLGRRPTDAEGAAAIEHLHDAWGNAYRYRVLDGGNYGTGEYYTLASAGSDGMFDTKDDLPVTASISRPFFTDGR
jgi:hypothetical protein